MFRERVFKMENWNVVKNYLQRFRFKLRHLFWFAFIKKFSNSECRWSFNSLLHISSIKFSFEKFPLNIFIPLIFEIFIWFLSAFYFFRLFDIFNFHLKHLKLSQKIISTQFSITWNPFVRFLFSFPKVSKTFPP